MKKAGGGTSTDTETEILVGAHGSAKDIGSEVQYRSITRVHHRNDDGSDSLVPSSWHA